MGSSIATLAGMNHRMKLARRSAIAGLVALTACRRTSQEPSMSTIRHRPLASLPATTLPWLSLRDHFVATVGPSAGTGSPRGPLLVLADATFAPHSRFPLHPHRDMEILSVVLTGTLSHHGDQAHGAVLPARTAQLISSRDGIVHAEGNDTDAPTRMLQIWFAPTTHGGAPAYFQCDLSKKAARQPVAGDAELPLRCDARVWWLDLEPGREEHLDVAKGRLGYLLALDGTVNAGVALSAGDGLDVGPGQLTVTASAPCAALWIDAAAA